MTEGIDGCGALRRRTRWLFVRLCLAPGLAALASTSPLQGQAAPACVASQSELHRAVAAVHEDQRNVGVAAAVFQNGRFVFSDSLGFANLEHRVPVSSQTVFGAASLTKVVTAVAVLRLWSEGRLDFDAPVQHYVPDFPVRAEGVITARLLATHRSGLPHPSQRSPELFATRYETATRALEIFRDVPLLHAPGSRRTYSSSNYNLLAAIVESVTGENFTEWVSTNVLRPAGLSHTRFDHVLAVVPGRAQRYSFYHPWTYAESDTLFAVPNWDYSFNQGGGGLLSTPMELAQLGGLLLRPGLLTAPALELLFSDDWFGRTDDLGRRVLAATGSNPGVQAGLVVIPEAGIAAAVLANTWGIGSRNAKMVTLPAELVNLCLGPGA